MQREVKASEEIPEIPAVSESESLVDLHQSDADSKDEDDIDNVIQKTEPVVSLGKQIVIGKDTVDEVKKPKKKPKIRTEVSLFLI